MTEDERFANWLAGYAPDQRLFGVGDLRAAWHGALYFTPAPDCPQCGEPSCDCVPMCPARLAESSVDDDWNHDGASVEYACELPPDHDGTHRDGSVTWSEEE